MRLPAAAGILLASCMLAGAEPSDGRKADAAFRAGMTAAQAGDNELAARNYRTALRHDRAPRVLLELARSLLLSGDYSESHRLFREVYSDPETPLAVKRNILPLMEEAELRTMRIRFGSRIVSDSNPGRVSNGTTIYFNGAPLTYQPARAKEVAYGIEPYLSIEKLWENGYLSSINLGLRLFEDGDLNSGLVGAAIGRQVDVLGGVFVQLRMDGEIKKGESYALPSVDAWKRIEISDRFRFGLGAQIGYMVSENSDIDGGYYRPYVFGDWSVMPEVTAFARISVEHLNSRNDYYTYVSPRIDVGLDLRMASWRIAPQLAVSTRTFREYDAFWGVTREDVTVRPSISVSNELLEFRGIRPELSLFYEERDSNIDINSYDQFGGFVNFRQAY